MVYEEKNSEVKRLTEQPPKDSSKLPKAKEQNKILKEDYENVNLELKTLMEDKFALESEQYDQVMRGMIDQTVKFMESMNSSLQPLISDIEESSKKRFQNTKKKSE